MPKKPRPSRFRLDPAVRPTRYELDLEPDLEAGTFRGTVRIALEISRRRPAITLHAADLEVSGATIARDGSGERVRIKRRVADEAVTIVPRAKLAGPVSLELSFSGKLGAHLRGFYGATANGRRYAFTQLEAAAARRMFSCFDEPSFKARFRVSVIVADGAAAGSN